MKKIVLGLAMVVMMFSMVGCSTEDKNNTPSTEQTSSTEDKNNTSSTEQATNTEYEFNKEFNLYVLSVEQAKEFITATEITTENYKDYFITWEETIEDKDVFGEVIGSYNVRMYGIKRELIGSWAIDKVFLLFDRYGYFLEDGSYFESVRDETNPFSGRLAIMGGSGSIGDVRDSSIYFDYECIKAKGNIFSVNIPEELWAVPKNDNENKGEAVLISVPSGKRYFLYKSEISEGGSLFDELYGIEY